MPPCDGIAVKNDVGGVRVVWVDDGARDIFSRHPSSGRANESHICHVRSRRPTSDRRKHLSVVETDYADGIIRLRNTDIADGGSRGEDLTHDGHRVALVS